MILTPEEYQKVFSVTPRLCVDLLIDHEDHVLLGKRSHQPFKGQFALPGGRVRYGETLRQAIDRIALNELGILVKSAFQFDVCEFMVEKSEMVTTHSVSIVFTCQVLGCPKTGSAFTEFRGSQWVGRELILSSHNPVIDRYLGMRKSRGAGFYTK